MTAQPVEHRLIGPRFSFVSLPEDDCSGWHWSCTCGAQASKWIEHWPESREEAEEEWQLHQA